MTTNLFLLCIAVLCFVIFVMCYDFHARRWYGYNSTEKNFADGITMFFVVLFITFYIAFSLSFLEVASINVKEVAIINVLISAMLVFLNFVKPITVYVLGLMYEFKMPKYRLDKEAIAILVNNISEPVKKIAKSYDNWKYEKRRIAREKFQVIRNVEYFMVNINETIGVDDGIFKPFEITHKIDETKFKKLFVSEKFIRVIKDSNKVIIYINGSSF